jgi:hypothetical protein
MMRFPVLRRVRRSGAQGRSRPTRSWTREGGWTLPIRSPYATNRPSELEEREDFGYYRLSVH